VPPPRAPRAGVAPLAGDAVVEEPLAATPFALFGLRACDATALAYQVLGLQRGGRLQSIPQPAPPPILVDDHGHGRLH
jgi:hypothetical protein